MTVRRVMGIETEYGISVPGKPHINSMMLSSQVVNAYAAGLGGPGRGKPRWDYEDETPLRDARGFDMTRADADPSQLTDEDTGMANVILTNGARLYVDHAHPEYSTPEVTTPRDAVVWDRAGEMIMAAAARRAALTPGGHPIRLYKNNTDNKGASYGTHENYLMRRSIPFNRIITGLTPFFVSRLVFAGAGRVGIGQDGSAQGFQLSARADFFEVEVGLETTVKRPIINTRDEPHADPERWRRLHVIVGDANLSETATYLKLGTTSLVLGLIEADRIDEGLMPADPVTELHRVSHDISLQHRIRTRDGRELTALQVQQEYLAAAHRLVGPQPDEETADVLAEWERVLLGLEKDPMSLTGELDWPAKLSIMRGYIRRDELSWGHPRLGLVDLQYADIDPERGLAQRLMHNGRMRRITSPAEVESAITTPPTDTRAWFRGECLRRFPERVAAAGWDSVVFDIPGQSSLQRVPTPDPLRGTKEHVADIMARAETPADLLRALAGG